MDRFQRIIKLYRELQTRRLPVSVNTLAEKLECGTGNVKKIIREMRDLGAPLAWDQKLKGYYLDKNSNDHFELPGLWFNPSELYALLTSYSLLSNVQPGWLNPYITPLKHRITGLLENASRDFNEIQQRVRIINIASRPTDLKHFQQTVTALIERKQLKMLYHGRARDKTDERTISPQRLVYYRNNWYLDAWCHLRNALRSFAIDRLYPVAMLDTAAREIDSNTLNQHYADAYGIFAGTATHTAVLLFSDKAAKWVADEHWHPQQHGEMLPNGRYQLHIPYSNPQELIMDILKYGPEVEVLEPDTLRHDIQKRLQATLQHYGEKN